MSSGIPQVSWVHLREEIFQSVHDAERSAATEHVHGRLSTLLCGRHFLRRTRTKHTFLLTHTAVCLPQSSTTRSSGASDCIRKRKYQESTNSEFLMKPITSLYFTSTCTNSRPMKVLSSTLDGSSHRCCFFASCN